MPFKFVPSSSFARVVIEGVHESVIPFILCKALQENKQTILHVSRDDTRLSILTDQLKQLMPQETILIFPQWDCLPYDRVSPKKDLIGRRLETLTHLLGPTPQPILILTTPMALLQKVMPKNILAQGSLHIKVGDDLAFGTFLTYAQKYGYNRVETVREPGEFAMRGSVIDLFPAQSESPFRLDFFGDTIETIRTFDEVSQRSLEALDQLCLYPAEEVILNDETIRLFRENYRNLTPALLEQDALYNAISQGIPFPGMDHWLPLFYPALSCLPDYLPKDWCLSIDDQGKQALLAALQETNDYYDARKKAPSKWGETIYNPVPPESFFLNAAAVEGLFTDQNWQSYSPYRYSEKAHFFKEILDFTLIRQQGKLNLIEALIDRIKNNPKPHIIACTSLGSLERLKSLLIEHRWPNVPSFDSITDALGALPRLGLVVFPLEKGFEGDHLIILSEQDIFGARGKRPQKKRRRVEIFLQETTTLAPGDFVVHSHHGIGRYEGLHTLAVDQIPHDCVCLSYDGGDRLYVPVENLDVLYRYSGEGSLATLDKLGSSAWQARKARVKKRLMEIADHLIRLAAERRLVETRPLIWDMSKYEEFSATFPYTETDDQARAIEETLEDFRQGPPMDRLICGDVGFGKTEVAMRAAFAVAVAGQQVAIVAPTTLLCRQHYESFSKRFRPFNMKIAQLSRLVPTKQLRLSKAEIEMGDTQIIIGTHGLLRGDMKFANLGLVVIDEEQHFGVKQKEKLKEVYPNLNLLTLSATPIPRTLQMALSGVRDLSLITTPPVDRLAVRTYVMPFDGVTIREAIMREIFRTGQVFVVCPRIEDLHDMEQRLKVLVPEARRITVHGQMAPSDIEDIMVAFCDQAYDVMLSTNIIESGLDLPQVNTILIHRADNFGLAQLYQLRGRVGRGKQRGYAYMTFDGHKTLTAHAQRRLNVIQSLDTLGGGFQIASHDMDIRGAGNLLGSEQSGHVKEVGTELYQHMLEEALDVLRNQETPEKTVSFTPSINLKIPVLIPADYVQDLSVRMDFYKRLSQVTSYSDLLDMKAEMIDRFGPLPEECLNLIDIIDLKILSRLANVERIDVGPRGAMISFYQNKFPNPPGLIALLHGSKGTLSLKPDHRLSYLRPWKNLADQKAGLKDILQQLTKISELSS